MAVVPHHSLLLVELLVFAPTASFCYELVVENKVDLLWYLQKVDSVDFNILCHSTTSILLLDFQILSLSFFWPALVDPRGDGGGMRPDEDALPTRNDSSGWILHCHATILTICSIFSTRRP
jgi:hypothetical protein